MFKAILFVPEVVPAIPIKPQRWILKEPVRLEISYPLEDGMGLADLYRPADNKKHPGVLLFLGVNPAGRDDPRVVRLAKGLARAGMVVMIPWSESMTQRRIDAGEIDNLVRAFQTLKEQDGIDPSKLGMGGFCVGASIAAVAAQDPRVAEDVKFLNFFGGYFNATDLIKAISAEKGFYDGEEHLWKPDELTKEVFTTELISSLEKASERDILSKIFLEGVPDNTIDVKDLSSKAQVVYRLLRGVSLEEAEKLIQQLPEEGLSKMSLISPNTNLNNLKARVLIMQNREDNLIPVEESRRFADALAEAQKNYYYTEFSFFQHVDPTKSVSPIIFLRESYKFLTHMYNVLRYAS